MFDSEYPVATIAKKADGRHLSLKELSAFFQGRQCRVTNENHIAALLMAACIKGLGVQESASLAAALAGPHSAHRDNLISVLSVGCHEASCGTKVALLAGILLASVGFPVEIVSVEDSRLTCRPVEYLEWIPGFHGTLPAPTLLQHIASSNIVVARLPKELAPACQGIDRLVAETATYSSAPLLASVILAPHLALGATHFVVNVWFGTGKLLPGREQAMEFGHAIAHLARSLERKAVVTVADAKEPFGRALGASLEVEEIVDVLSGNGPADIREHSLNVAARAMIAADASYDFAGAKAHVAGHLESQKTLRTFIRLVRRQGGRALVIGRSDSHHRVGRATKVLAQSSGYINSIDLAALQPILAQLDPPSPSSRTGIILQKSVGDQVRAGEPLACVVGKCSDVPDSFRATLVRAFCIQPHPSSAATHPPMVIT